MQPIVGSNWLSGSYRANLGAGAAIMRPNYSLAQRSELILAVQNFGRQRKRGLGERITPTCWGPHICITEP